MTMYRQLWLAIIISTLLALMGSLFASMYSARNYLQSQLSIKNTDNAAALALSLSQSNPDAVSVELAVSALFDSGHYELIRVVDPLGSTIVERKAQAGDLDAPTWFVRHLPIRAEPGHAQISNGWQQFGTVTVVSHSRFAYRALWESVLKMVGALAVAGLIGGYLGTLILRRLKAPLRAVIDQATAIAGRRFITIAEPRVPELRQLAVAMNMTVGRLKSMFEDETARIEALRRDANFDPLTGLANRSHFMACLQQALDSEDATSGALIMIRITDLADVNHRLGRVATDDLLRQLGEAIGQCTAQNPEGIAARLNGADFAVLLPNEHDGRRHAEAALKSLVLAAGSFVETDNLIRIGIGHYDPGMDLSTLLARVDAALAGAEQGSENAIRDVPADYGTELPHTAERWSALIRLALDQQWVRIASFPVVSLSEGKLLHHECPLRLKLAEKADWLPAGRFMPIAERLRLTSELDLAAVRLGLDKLATHPDMPGLAINISASSLAHNAFGKDLRRLLTSHPAEAKRLWLDVAESGALRHLSPFRELCLSLKDTGCRIGLEHFGHQFSQIGRIHDLGLDFIKMDASFARSLDGNPGNQSFLKGVAGIARNLGLMIVAEGVTTPEELAALRAIGFDGATGPVIADSSR